MIRRPPRSTQSRSSAASDVYKRQLYDRLLDLVDDVGAFAGDGVDLVDALVVHLHLEVAGPAAVTAQPAPRVFAHCTDSMLLGWAALGARRNCSRSPAGSRR